MQCQLCKNAFISPTAYSNHPAAQLTNMKSEGYLIHPNEKCYQFIRHLEFFFQKHCHSGAVFELVLEDILKQNSFTFPCKDHMHDIVPHLIQYYILMRMRQFSLKTNQEKKKLFQQKKKVSKFCTS